MTKSDFLSILSIQSDRLRSEYDKPGWNMWALLGALVSISWGTLELYSNDKLEFQNSTYIFLTVVLLDPLISYLYIQFKAGKGGDTNLYKNLKVELRSSFFMFVYKLLIYITLFVICNFYLTFETLEVITLNTYIIGAFIFYIFAIVLTQFNLHVKVNSKSKNVISGRIYSVVITILLGYSTYIFLSRVEDINVACIQTVMLFSGIYFISLKTIEHAQSNSLLDSLDELIDKVTFDEISVEDAEKQLYIIVNGIEFSQIMAPLVNEYQAALEEHQEELKVAFSRIEKYKASNDPETQRMIVDAVTQGFERLQDHNTKIYNLKVKLEVRIAFYSSFEKGSEEYDKLREKFTSWDEKRKEDTQKLYDLINATWGEKE